jgi:hypothetical protein
MYIAFELSFCEYLRRRSMTLRIARALFAALRVLRPHCGICFGIISRKPLIAFCWAFAAFGLVALASAWRLQAQTQTSPQSSNQLLTGSPRSSPAIAASSSFPAEIARSAFAPFIIEGEDRFQSYIHDDAIAVWVNLPSLRADGDTLSVIVKRVVRRNVAHTLVKDLVYVDLFRFNTRDDTFVSFASLNPKTGAPTLNPKPEWEKTSLDPDMNALYHFIGFLRDEAQKQR